MPSRDRLIVALDVPTAAAAFELVDRLAGHVGAFKIGKELFTSAGPEVVRGVNERGGRVFLDLKFHDIPNTVAGAVRAAAQHGVWMVNVHAAGGAAMCRAAADAAKQAGGPRPLVIGVTVLTSLDRLDLQTIGLAGSPREVALRLAKLAQEGGLDGVVSGADEATAIKELCGRDFLVVTPGIRPTGSAAGDQKRITTPETAVRAGADYLVVGRPITGAADPAAAADAIVAEIEAALG
jgi:orotidine-5'-phosphate decarboxylase